MRPLVSEIVLRAQGDERLVALARDGHDQAFVAIARRYRRELIAHARRMTSADHAEDVVQQATLSAWAALGRHVEVLDVRAWLHRIVHNTALRTARRSERHLELTEELASTSLTDLDAERRIDARNALVALSALPERQRRALELTALGGSTGREAAAALGVSEGMLRQLVHRARTTLRSAAAAVIPAPLVDWAASSGGDPVAARIAEICAGPGLAAAVTKVAASVAVTASVVGGANQVLLSGHERANPSSPVQPAAGQASAARGAVGAFAALAARVEPSIPVVETQRGGGGGGGSSVVQAQAGQATGAGGQANQQRGTQSGGPDQLGAQNGSGGQGASGAGQGSAGQHGGAAQNQR